MSLQRSAVSSHLVKTLGPGAEGVRAAPCGLRSTGQRCSQLGREDRPGLQEWE